MSAADALPPAPWASVIDLVGEPGPAAPEGLDAVEHGGLAVCSGVRGGAHRPGPPDGLSGIVHDTAARLLEHGPAPRTTGRTQRRLGLLNPVDTVGGHDQAMIECPDDRHLATVVAGQPDREQAPPASLGERAEQVDGVAARGDPEGDVARAARGR